MSNIQVIIRTTYHTSEEEVQKIIEKIPQDIDVKIKKVYKDSKEYYEFNRGLVSKSRRKNYREGNSKYTQKKERNRTYAKGYKVTDKNNNEITLHSMKELCKFFGYHEQTIYSKLRKSNELYGYKVERIL